MICGAYARSTGQVALEIQDAGNMRAIARELVKVVDSAMDECNSRLCGMQCEGRSKRVMNNDYRRALTNACRATSAYEQARRMHRLGELDGKALNAARRACELAERALDFASD